MLKRVLPAAGFVLLVASLVAAWYGSQEEAQARVVAGERLGRAARAAADAHHALVLETAVALRAYREGDPPPLPIRRWGAHRGSDPAPATLSAEFLAPGSLEVTVPADGGAVFARVPAAEVRARIVRHADVGEPSTKKAAGLYDHLAFADREGRVVLRLVAPEDEQPHERRLWPHDHESEGLQRIARGAPLDAAPDGTPPAYKGPRSERILAASAATQDGSLRVLVEVTEREALSGVSGWDVTAFGYRIGRARLWHVLLGASLLCLVTWVFAWVVTRGGRIAVLLRVYSFARPYVAGILLTIFAGALFSAAQISKTYIVKRLFDDVLVNPGPGVEGQIWFLGWATAGVGVAMAVTGYFRAYLQNLLSTAMMADVRLALGKKIVSLPMGYFHAMRAGDLVSRIERDATSLRVILHQVFETVFTQPFVLAGSLLAAFMMNWRLAVVLLGLPILVWPILRIARSMRSRAEKRQVLLAEMSHVIFQMLTGIKVVKAFGGEKREVDRLSNAIRSFMRQARKLQRLSALSHSLVDLMQMVGGAFLVVVGGYGILEGGVSVGDLGAFMLVAQQCYHASKEITGLVNKFVEATPGTERVFEVLDAKDTLLDGPREMLRGPLRDGIEFRDVRFRYREADVLRGVSIRVPAGKVVALVGPTGAGKTTVCDLVARFYDATSGSVTIDGADVREFTKASLLANVALVTQDAFLFNATVEENIRYGRDDATREEIEAAARAASVHDEILAMEGGYSKTCGERGTSVSGGQRQRITIARALLKDAPILILDEATSNLDSHAEAQVQAALARLMKGRTVLVVAHRLSTIRNADRVIVLEGGRVAEEGSPGELLDRPESRFRKMYDLQSSMPDDPPPPEPPDDLPPDLGSPRG